MSSFAVSNIRRSVSADPAPVSLNTSLLADTSSVSVSSERYSPSAELVQVVEEWQQMNLRHLRPTVSEGGHQEMIANAGPMPGYVEPEVPVAMETNGFPVDPLFANFINYQDPVFAAPAPPPARVHLPTPRPLSRSPSSTGRMTRRVLHRPAPYSVRLGEKVMDHDRFCNAQWERTREESWQHLVAQKDRKASVSIEARDTFPLHSVCFLFPLDRKSTRLNSSHSGESRMPSSA